MIQVLHQTLGVLQVEIDDCGVDFDKVKQFFIRDLNDSRTREFIIAMCKWMDPAWFYACDDTNNPPDVVNDNDLIISGFKRTNVGHKEFTWSFTRGFV